MPSPRRLTPLLLLALLVHSPRSGAQALTRTTLPHAMPERDTVPAWLYPVALPTPGAPPPDSTVPLRLPRSLHAFTRAQVTDLYTAVDWYPSSHPAMPAVVATGRRPGVFACGYCHLPAGGGRPENAALAGLPADYIMRQVKELKSGARRNALAAPHRPWDLMHQVAVNATDDDVQRAAAYFSRLALPRRVRIVEVDRVPRTHVAGALLAVTPGAGDEPIDGRIIEVSEDQERFELRDERSGFIAYAPTGSVARGRALAGSGVGGAAGCATCHGPSLRGGIAPPIAGQSPSYLMRQLVAFRNGARAGSASAPMQAMTSALPLQDMVALSAYVGSLSPRQRLATPAGR